MPWHTLLLTIIASYTKLSSEMVLALSNKSVLFQWVSEGALPKYRELEPHHACTVGQNGAECPTVSQIWAV
jgi:hypothetical protein